MANEEHLNILMQGVEVWNKWRKLNPKVLPDLTFADLSGANLNEANLTQANLFRANLSGADLKKADLTIANLRVAILSGADLSEAYLRGAHLGGATLDRANLGGAYLVAAYLGQANFSEANLSGADLTKAMLDEANLDNTNLTNCRIYGISVWNIKGKPKEQTDLIITPDDEPTVVVDNLEVAQFVYLLLKNEKIRDVIQTIGQKGVLILGRFYPPGRKEVLDTIAEQLRQRGFLPIMFDFEKSTERDFTETIKILAGLSLFVIVDITNPKSSPLELQATVPDYMIPFVPIIQKDEKPFSMFKDLTKYEWVLKPVRAYDTKENLIEMLEEAIIKPAIQKHNELIRKKAEELEVKDIRDFLSKE